MCTLTLDGGPEIGTRQVDMGATFICGTGTEEAPVNPLYEYICRLQLQTRVKHRDGPLGNQWYSTNFKAIPGPYLIPGVGGRWWWWWWCYLGW